MIPTILATPPTSIAERLVFPRNMDPPTGYPGITTFPEKAVFPRFPIVQGSSPTRTPKSPRDPQKGRPSEISPGPPGTTPTRDFRRIPLGRHRRTQSYPGSYPNRRAPHEEWRSSFHEIYTPPYNFRHRPEVRIAAATINLVVIIWLVVLVVTIL